MKPTCLTTSLNATYCAHAHTHTHRKKSRSIRCNDRQNLEKKKKKKREAHKMMWAIAVRSKRTSPLPCRLPPTPHHLLRHSPAATFHRYRQTRGPRHRCRVKRPAASTPTPRLAVETTPPAPAATTAVLAADSTSSALWRPPPSPPLLPSCLQLPAYCLRIPPLQEVVLLVLLL